MKNKFLLPILLLSLISCSIETDSVVERNGLYYEDLANSISGFTPFTGEVTGKEKGRVEDGKKEGKWVGYHDDGDLRYRGNYKNGKEEGEWVYYHDNGDLRYRGNYKNGKGDGEWVYYHENGQVSSKGNYKNGKRDGEWVYYHENGQVSMKGSYKNGEKVSELNNNQSQNLAKALTVE
jgi:antitoxin component YwqK of YwqJK toxin-antitoxin module